MLFDVNPAHEPPYLVMRREALRQTTFFKKPMARSNDVSHTMCSGFEFLNKQSIYGGRDVLISSTNLRFIIDNLVEHLST